MTARCNTSRWGGRGAVDATPAGRVEHDRRCRCLGVGAERLRQRLHELAQGSLRFRGRRRGRSGDHEQRPRLGCGESGEVGAGAAEQRPSTALAGLRVHGDAGDGEGLEIAPCRLDRHLQLLGQLGSRDAPLGLEHQQRGDEAIGAHVTRVYHRSGHPMTTSRSSCGQYECIPPSRPWASASRSAPSSPSTAWTSSPRPEP